MKLVKLKRIGNPTAAGINQLKICHWKIFTSIHISTHYVYIHCVPKYEILNGHGNTYGKIYILQKSSYQKYYPFKFLLYKRSAQ